MKNPEPVGQLSFSDMLFPVPDVVPDTIIKPKIRRRQSASEFFSRQICLSLDFVFGTLLDGDEIPAINEQEAILEWTDEDILLIHEKILSCTIALIHDNRASLQNRLNSIDWIFSDQLITVQEALTKPMSFQACCIVSYVDPELMRKGVIHVIKQTNLWELDVVQDMFV